VADNLESPRVSYRLYNPGRFPLLAPIFSLLLPGVLFAINAGHLRGRAYRWLRRCQTITERVILLCDSVGWYSSNPRESHEVAV